MTFRAVAAAALLALTLAAPARAEVQRASAGPVAAEFSFTYKKDAYSYTGLTLTITRDGAVVHRGLPRTPGCGTTRCAPGGGPGEQAVHVADLDADGEPEVLLDLYTGGAHCCLVAHVFRWTGTEYTITSHDFADAGYRLARGNDRWQLVSADARFAYRWAAFAFSVLPVQVYEFDGRELVDVTAGSPARVRADARRAWREYRSLRRRKYEVRGAIAAWAANRYRLGERAATLRTLRSMARRGRLPGVGPRSQTAFVTDLDRTLRAWGYTS